MNICTPAMTRAGALTLRSARAGDFDKGTCKLIWEAMEHRRLADEAHDRNAATERRAAANTPWNTPPRDEIEGRGRLVNGPTGP